MSEPPEHHGTRVLRKDIEGLRGIAVALVVLYHLNTPHFYGGFIGVDVFFVISGFVITTRLLDRRGEPRVLAEFYAGRVRRLVPLSLVVISAVFAALALRLGSIVTHYGAEVRSTALFGWNLWAVHWHVSYGLNTFAPSPFEHFWSLATEEQFYLLWPAVLLVIAGRAAQPRRRSLAAVAVGLGAVSLTSMLLIAPSSPLAAFYLLPTRVWEILAGALVAIVAPRLTRVPGAVTAVAGWAGLAMVLIAADQFLSGPLDLRWRSTLPVLGAVLVIGGVEPSVTWGPARLLSLRPLAGLGAISFALNLWHWPVIILFLRERESTPGNKVIAVAISLALAVGSHLLIERPIRWRLRMSADPRTVLVVGAGLTAVVVLVASVFSSRPVLDAGKPSRPGVVTTYVPSDLDPPILATQSFRDFYPPRGCPQMSLTGPGGSYLPPICVRGDTSGTTTIALMGDSHAAHWIPAFEEAARRRHSRLLVFFEAGCPWVDVAMGISQPDMDCHRSWSTFVAQLGVVRPDVLVLADYDAAQLRQSSRADYLDVARRSAARFSSTRLVVLGDVPQPQTDPGWCLAEHVLDISPCDIVTSRSFDPSVHSTVREIARNIGATYVDTVPWICPAARCPVIDGNLLLYRDLNHLAAPYARSLAPEVGDVLDQALSRGL